MVPERKIGDSLFNALSSIEKDLSLHDLMCSFIIVVLMRNKGNRTHTSEELKIPLRTLRFKLCAIESLGYKIPTHEVASRRRRRGLKFSSKA
jgi:hypothetical protein